MSSFNFEYPELLLLPLLFLFCERFCPEKSSAIIFPNTGFFNSVSNYKLKTLQILKWLSILLLTVAISSPFITLKESSEPKDGLNIALLLDTSDSMRAIGFSEEKFTLNRFEVVKEIVIDFINKRESDNLGIVVFGEYAFVSSPLTYDKGILSKMVDQLRIGVAGRSTAIYDAIGQSVSLLKKEDNSSNIAILLTDGLNTSGIIEKEQAIRVAKNSGIKIYTIGIGQQGEFNPLLLQEVAEETGGKAFMAKSGEELKLIYEEIDRLEKREVRDISYEVKEYLYFYPLIFSMLSLLIYITLKNRRELI
jgi:Ca-activated chloride channel family protein